MELNKIEAALTFTAVVCYINEVLTTSSKEITDIIPMSKIGVIYDYMNSLDDEGIEDMDGKVVASLKKITDELHAIVVAE